MARGAASRGLSLGRGSWRQVTGTVPWSGLEASRPGGVDLWDGSIWPSRRARPTIAPSAPAPSSAATSSSERMPPAARTGRPELSTTRRTSSTSGPCSVPSRSIAVQSRRARAPRRSGDRVVDVERALRPARPRMTPSRTSSATTSRRRAPRRARRAAPTPPCRRRPALHRPAGAPRRPRRCAHRRTPARQRARPPRRGPRRHRDESGRHARRRGRRRGSSARPPPRSCARAPRLAVLRRRGRSRPVEADGSVAEEIDGRDDFHRCCYVNVLTRSMATGEPSHPWQTRRSQSCATRWRR